MAPVLPLDDQTRRKKPDVHEIKSQFLKKGKEAYTSFTGLFEEFTAFSDGERDDLDHEGVEGSGREVQISFSGAIVRSGDYIRSMSRGKHSSYQALRAEVPKEADRRSRSKTNPFVKKTRRDSFSLDYSPERRRSIVSVAPWKVSGEVPCVLLRRSRPYGCLTDSWQTSIEKKEKTAEHI